MLFFNQVLSGVRLALKRWTALLLTTGLFSLAVTGFLIATAALKTDRLTISSAHLLQDDGAVFFHPSYGTQAVSKITSAARLRMFDLTSDDRGYTAVVNNPQGLGLRSDASQGVMVLYGDSRDSLGGKTLCTPAPCAVTADSSKTKAFVELNGFRIPVQSRNLDGRYYFDPNLRRIPLSNRLVVCLPPRFLLSLSGASLEEAAERLASRFHALTPERVVS